jgi:hypothetical protein
MTLSNCAICQGAQDAMREHCKYCGARRVFIAHHSYQAYQIVVKARDECNGKELVRAFYSQRSASETA